MGEHADDPALDEVDSDRYEVGKIDMVSMVLLPLKKFQIDLGSYLSARSICDVNWGKVCVLTGRSVV